MSGSRRTAAGLLAALLTLVVAASPTAAAAGTAAPVAGATTEAVSPVVVPAAATAGTEARIVTVPPSRLADTRSGLGGHRGTVPARGLLTIQVGGRAGIPATGASAVVLTLTVVGPAAAGYVTAYPAGQQRPTASNLNFAARQTIANSAVVRLGAQGAVTVYTSATAHVLVDVSAWHPTGSTFAPTTPTRVLDTRATWGDWPPRDGLIEVRVAGGSGVPASAQAVAINLTTVGATTPGFVTAFAQGEDPPATSNVNFPNGATVAAAATVRVGLDGYIRLRIVGQAHLLVDVSGYYTAASEFTPIAPSRLLDTRSTGRLPAGGTATVDLSGLPGLSGATLLTPVLTVTATGSGGPGYLTVYGGTTRPTVSSLNFATGQTIANQVIAQPGTGPSLTIYTPTSTHVVVDVVGYVAAAPSLGRALDVSAFGAHACARTAAGAAYCWGNNSQGQVGDGSTTNRGRATPVSGLGAGVKQVVASWGSTCAVLETNELRCWGDNSSQQLGLPGTTDRPTPTPLLPATVLPRTVALDSSHGCAVTGDELSCWGGGFGAPEVVSGLSHGVQAVGVGADFTCVLSTLGEVLCFGGINAYGQLGSGPQATDGRPGRLVPLRADAVRLSVGSFSACAELVDSSTWCWGSGKGNVRGDGSTDGAAEPVERRSNDLSHTLRMGPQVVCAVDLVLATAGCSDRPLADEPRSVAAVAPGNGFTCDVLRDGRVTCRGYNAWGQLGDGTTTTRTGSVTVIGFG